MMNALRNIFRHPVKPPRCHTREISRKYYSRNVLACNRIDRSTNLHQPLRTYAGKCVSCGTLSAGRHCYHDECEAAINAQINIELNAAYAYLAMACYFGRSDVAMPGCHGFFIKMHEEEMGHAQTFIKYQNTRGGRVKLCPLTCTDCTEWDMRKALECSLEMEKIVKEKLVRAHECAQKHQDLDMMDMLVSVFIAEQERSICEMCRLLTRYNAMTGCAQCGCGEYLFDQHMHSSYVKKAEKRETNNIELIYK